MSLGSDLIKLQETDLELAKLGKQLGSLPIIDELSLRRSHLFGRLPKDVQGLYERSSKRFKGLCVERIQGNVPTVCRTALQPASMDALRHATDYAECPYCHRIIVVNEQE